VWHSGLLFSFMGNFCVSGETKNAKEKSARIEREIKKTEQESVDNVSILLLGAGESGKSTIAKPISLIFMSG